MINHIMLCMKLGLSYLKHVMVKKNRCFRHILVHAFFQGTLMNGGISLYR